MTQPVAMALSIGLEVPVALAVGRAASADEPSLRLLAVAVAATLVTHPFAWAGANALVSVVGVWGALAIVEVAVWLVESALYAKVAGLGWRWGAVAGVASNAVSTAYGVLVTLGIAPG